MWTWAPAYARPSRRSWPKSSMCHWRRCTWCWATPKARRTRGRPSPAPRCKSMPGRCAGAPLAAGAGRAALGRGRCGVDGARRHGAAGRRQVLELAEATATKPVADYTLVGRSVPRVDIPAKVRGAPVFVHDLRLPGMLHGRVVRPPYAGADHGEFIGNTLVSRHRSSVGLRWPSKRIAALHRLPIRSVLAARCALRYAPMAARSLRHLIR